jgi:hypothetical protein
VRAALGTEADPRAIALAKGRPGRAVALQALAAPKMAEALEQALRRLAQDGPQSERLPAKASRGFVSR